MYVFANNKIEVGFGDKGFELDHLRKYYPEKQICSLEQVHGDDIISAHPESEAKADAHFTEDPKHILVIKTADCVPVMIYNPTTDCVAAVHAGWRGVAKRIIPQTLEKICSSATEKQVCQIWIGPHIQQPSFEVGPEVIEDLKKSTHNPTLEFHQEAKKKNKYLVDLNLIVRQQLKELGTLEENIQSMNVDTFTNDAYYSYRKGDKGSRLYSYIFLNT